MLSILLFLTAWLVIGITVGALALRHDYDPAEDAAGDVFPFLVTLAVTPVCLILAVGFSFAFFVTSLFDGWNGHAIREEAVTVLYDVLGWLKKGFVGPRGAHGGDGDFLDDGA